MADRCDHAFLEYSLTHEVYVCIHCGVGDWPTAGADRGETPSDRPTTPITDTPEDFARALGITPEEP